MRTLITAAAAAGAGTALAGRQRIDYKLIGTLHDANDNAVPDECEFTNCNENDIADGTSEDCNGNGGQAS